MKRRIAYLDFLRCLAIGLVIVLHVMVPFVGNVGLYGKTSWFFCLAMNTLNRTGVPLFFMISGYLHLNSGGSVDVGRFYRRNIPKLLVPLCVWTLIYSLYSAWHGGTGFRVADYLAALLNNGSAYHMWFVYTMLGMYLLIPFLKRIVDGCTRKQLWLLLGIVLFPTTLRPMVNVSLPVYLYLFEPLVEGYVGYLLFGYLLATAKLSRRARLLVYAGGVFGYGWGTFGNLLTASAESIPLPFNLGYSVNHYLCAGAIFVFVRAVFERHESFLAPAGPVLAGASDLVFGVYWVHVLVLSVVNDVVLADLTVMELVAVQTVLTAVVSFGFAWVVSKVPGLRRALM